MDTGDLLAQEVIEVPAGISYVQLEQRCAIRGGELLARTVYDLYAGRATRVPQDESKSSYQPFPGEEDYKEVLLHAPNKDRMYGGSGHE